jgi:integrase
MGLQNDVSNPHEITNFDEWLATRPDLSAGSKKKYAAAIRMFKRSRDGVSVEGLGNFLSKHRHRHVKAALLLYCKFLAKTDIAAELRDMRVKYSRNPPREIPGFDDFLTVINSCDKETRHLSLFLLYTGCRCQEALTVKLKDFNREGAVMIRDIKVEGKYREIHLPDDYFQELMNYLIHEKGVLENQTIFYTGFKGSRETHRADFYTKLNTVALRKLNRPIQTHDFRRFCASFLYDKTGDLEFVNKIMGHSDISTTHKYTQYAKRARNLKRSKGILGELRTRQNKTAAAQA